MDTERAEKLASDIERIVNCMGNDDECSVVVEKLLGMHRTLNQSFVSKFILPFLRGMNNMYEKGWYDDRNVAACKVCSLMWKSVCKEHGFKETASPTLPTI